MTRLVRSRVFIAALIAGVWLVAEARLAACPVCFQMEDGPVTEGVRAAVLVLLAITTAVLSGFAFFIVGFVRRSR
jgi:hypothetical protein